MQQADVRKVVAAHFYKSLAESGVQVTAIPTEQLTVLVNAFADSIFSVIDALEEEDTPDVASAPTGAPGQAMAGTASPGVSSTVSPTMAAGADETPSGSNPGHAGEEPQLWRGRPYLTIGTRYELTSQRIRIFRGILGNAIDEIELIRVKDTRVKQHAGERMINVGDISVFSADVNTPEFILHNVRRPIEVRELIRRAVMNEKARKGMYYREDIGNEDIGSENV